MAASKQKSPRGSPRDGRDTRNSRGRLTWPNSKTRSLRAFARWLKQPSIHRSASAWRTSWQKAAPADTAEGPWAHRFGVVLVAAAILVVFFVPLPHLSLFKRLVSSPNPSPATSRSKTLPVGTRLAELRGSDTVAGDYFGAAVAIDGDTAVVGAFEHDNDAGRAYVFSKTSSGWKQTAELEGSDIVAGDNFGVAVGISGTTIVVGASSYEQSSAGRAYVFTKTESGWKQVAELSGPGGRAVQEHISVAISDATIVIGWNYPNYSPSVPGVAWVYADTATGWRRTAILGVRIRPLSATR